VFLHDIARAAACTSDFFLPFIDSRCFSFRAKARDSLLRGSSPIERFGTGTSVDRTIFNKTVTTG
jgi:hypothetical protein